MFELVSVTVDAIANVHEHLREGDEIVESLVKYVVDGGADVVLPMPNTTAGLTTPDQVLDYVCRVRRFVPSGRTLHFIPTMLVNEYTLLDRINEAVDKGIYDVKLLPKYRTTKSDNGFRHPGALLPIVKRCGEKKVKVHIHPEHPWMIFDSRDAEFAFLPIGDIFLNETKAIIIWEHGTDGRCVPFWKYMAKSGRFYLTLTIVHLLEDENGAYGDARSTLRPAMKTPRDKRDLNLLVEEDHEWVMLGPDGAPHKKDDKHPPKDRCACGSFTSPFLAPLCGHALGHLFEKPNGAQTFSNFTSRNPRKLHGLPAASRHITLKKQLFEIPLSYPVGSWEVESFWAGRFIDWTLA